MVAVFYDHLAQLELRLATAGGVLREDVLLRFVQDLRYSWLIGGTFPTNLEITRGLVLVATRHQTIAA